MKLSSYISQLLSVLFAALALASCVYEDLPSAEDEQPDVQPTFVTFELTLPNIDPTRTPAGDYDPGTAEWENYIDIQDGLKFYIFDGTEVTATSKPTFVTALDPASTFIEELHDNAPGSDFKHYRVRSIVRQQLTAPLRLVALANCPQYPTAIDNKLYLNLNGTQTQVNTLDALSSKLTYTMPAEPLTKLDADHLIPMFGISRVETLPKLSDNLESLGKIHMLRAMAKIDVMVAAEETHDLAEVTLHRYNRNGLCCPTGVYQESDYVKGNYDADYVGHVSLPASTGYVNGTLAFAHNGNTITYTRPDNTTCARRIYTIYVPEYRNLQGNDLAANYSYLTLKFDDPNDSREFPLFFKHYNKTGTPHFNIERNNYYKYTVRRGDFDVQIVVDVIPYIGVVLEPLFGFDDFLPPPTS